VAPLRNNVNRGREKLQHPKGGEEKRVQAMDTPPVILNEGDGRREPTVNLERLYNQLRVMRPIVPL
jgi:hypothetical protein